MQYPYLVAHRDSALAPIELAMHPLSREELIREYEHVDFPFRFFFDGGADVKALYEQLPNAAGLKITIEPMGSSRMLTPCSRSSRGAGTR